jgi:predicted esterase
LAIEHHIEVTKTARYYILEPKGETKRVLFTIHGYRQLAKYFIRQFQPLTDVGIMVVAPEGLHRFYIEGYDGRVGASWMTKEDREIDIKDYVNYLNKLHSELAISSDIPIDILGFSQGGPTACRWLANAKFDARKLILHSTVFPNDFDFKGNMKKLANAQIYSVFGDEDQFASEKVIIEKMAWMKAKGVDSDLRRFNGGHIINIQSLKNIYSV